MDWGTTSPLREWPGVGFPADYFRCAHNEQARVLVAFGVARPLAQKVLSTIRL